MIWTHLECDTLYLVLSDLPYGFVHFEAIVLGQQSVDSCVQEGIFEDFRRDRIDGGRR
jgi:hypothetical protein